MTAHKKLGALFATAFLALALSGGAAMAGHGHRQDNSQSWNSQYRYSQDGSYRHQFHKKGKAFGRDARRYHHGYGRYYEYRRHFGFGYPYYYGYSTILYGRSYYGNRRYSGGAYGTPRPVQPEPNNGLSE